MLASTVTLASEYAPERQRNLILGVVLAGYPIGATLSGIVAAQIIPTYGWRAMFTFAGLCTLISLPFAIFILKESWEWLIKRQPKNALIRVNFIAESMNYAALTELPIATAAGEKAPVSEMLAGLLGSERRATTIKLWSAFFPGFATLYYLTTWIPGLAERTGMSTTMAIYAGTVFNLGAIFGNPSQGYSSQKVGLRSSIIAFYIFTATLMALFGFVSGDWTTLLVFGLIGFGVQGGLVGLYTIAARVYPAEIRNTGVGWAIGLGRAGAIISPIIGGVLAAQGMAANVIMLAFAVPLVVACLAVWLIKSIEIN
jgi:MFS transporter, AAHS family, 4-hydroxybenzoate transporter